MFFEIRCGDLFSGQHYERFATRPTVGEVIEIDGRRFLVFDVRDEARGLPVVELAIE